MTNIEQIKHLPADFGKLVHHSEQEGFVFLRRMNQEWRDNANRFCQSGEFLLAAVDSDQLVGVCGVNIDPYVNSPSTARLRHLYVAPPRRSEAIGTQLVRTCLDLSRQTFSLMRLRVPNVETGAFYEKLGFTAVRDATASHTLDLTNTSVT